jgi:hypothetical protein
MNRRTYDPNLPAFYRALDEVRPELEAIPSEQLLPIRVDVMTAAIGALGVAADVKPFRDRVAAELGEPVARYLDRLEGTARACSVAHAQHLMELRGEEVAELIERLSQTRRVLLLEAQGLVSQKLLRGSVLAELVGGTGYHALCLDVLQLVSALRAEWATIAGRTPVTALELDQADALANAVATTLGENERGASSSISAEMRQRAYTLFVRTYEEVRRAMTFIRWKEDDVDDIVPSLYAGKSAKSKKADDKGKGDDGSQPIQGATPHTSPSPTSGPAPVAPGMPGGSPFVST